MLWGFRFVAGTIPQARIGTLQRVLWRVLRGNLYMNFTPIEKPFHEVPGKETDEKWIRKSVFIVFTRESPPVTSIVPPYLPVL